MSTLVVWREQIKGSSFMRSGAGLTHMKKLYGSVLIDVIAIEGFWSDFDLIFVENMTIKELWWKLKKILY
jgi:hypothetical protein